MTNKVFNKKYKMVFDACRKALETLEVTVEISDLEKGTIVGMTKTTLWSWGENIQIIFETINESSTRIEVESTSNSQIFSWGKNKANENSIIEIVSKILDNS